MEKSYSNIKYNIDTIKDNIANAALSAGRNPEDISLMAVTKTVPPEKVNVAIHSGVALLGENRAQELLSKVDYYDKDNAEIHFIGALQSNKVRQIVDHVSMIHSVDRLSLAKEIDKQCATRNKIMDVLIQVNIGAEDTKSGVATDEILDLAHNLEDFKNIRLRGLMCIPPVLSTKKELEQYFYTMKQYLVDIQSKKGDNNSVNVLSMGMSGDYETAVAHGATIVRVGSAIFGERS